MLSERQVNDMPNELKTYQLQSVKWNEQITTDSAEHAISRAREIDREYWPAYGVQVIDEDGECIYDSGYRPPCRII